MNLRKKLNKVLKKHSEITECSKASSIRDSFTALMHICEKDDFDYKHMLIIISDAKKNYRKEAKNARMASKKPTKTKVKK